MDRIDAPIPVAPGDAPADEAGIRELLELAWSTHKSETRQALNLALEGREAARRLDSPPLRARAAFIAGMCHYLLSGHETALKFTQEALAHYGKAAAAEDLVRVRNMLGNIFWATGRPDEARREYELCLEIARNAGNEAAAAGALSNLGTYHSEAGNFVEALRHFQDARELMERLPEAPYLCIVLSHIAGVHRRMGQYAQALEVMLECLRVTPDEEPYSRSESLRELANLYRETGDLKAARETAAEVLAATERVGSRSLIATARVLLAEILAEEGANEEAARLFDAALADQRNGEERLELVETLLRRGEFRARTGMTAGALADLEECRVEAEKIGLTQMATEAKAMRGAVLMGCGRASEALVELESALTLALSSKAPDLELRVRQTLSALAEQQGEHRAACAHLHRVRELDQQLHDKRSDDKFRRMLAGHELERAQADAARERARNEQLAQLNDELHRQGAELAAANRQLEKLGAEKSALLIEVQRLADEDALTGLHNRRHFNERFAAELERSHRFSRPLSVALLDIDHFKRINDRFLHATGDEVLREVGRIIRGAIRSIDYAARYGGEEFVLLLPETPQVEARVVCERIRTQIAAQDWSGINPELAVTASIGVAESGVDGRGDVLQVADQRLYAAKEAGRNRTITR